MVDVLVIEDNREIGALLLDFLAAEGYSGALRETGEGGLAFFETEGARLVVLDVMLPGMDGFAVCRKLREKDNTPLLIVSAKGSKEDKLNGLILGADDYIEKPYDVDLRLAKSGGILRRRYASGPRVCGDIEIDRAGRMVRRNGQEVKLTAKEYELLLLLAENRGQALSKELLFNRVWGLDSFSEPQTLTVHIKWLREKLEDDPKQPKHIRTVWGVGYRFED